MMLYQVLISSLNIVNTMAFDRETRRKLAEDILEQQEDKEFLALNKLDI